MLWCLTFHWLKSCHVMSFHSCVQLDSISWNDLQILTCCVLVHRRPGSDFKRREMHGSGIFNGSGSGQSDGNGAHADRTTVRMHQVIIALCMSLTLAVKIYLFLEWRAYSSLYPTESSPLLIEDFFRFENCSSLCLLFSWRLFLSFMSLYVFQLFINIHLKSKLIWRTGVIFDFSKHL